MPIIPTVDGGTLLNALRMGRQDREAFEDRSLQRMFTQQKMDDARRESERQGKLAEAYANVFGGGDVAGAAGGQVSGGRPSPVAPRAGMFDPQKLRSLMALGPEGLQAAKSLMEMDEVQVKAAKARVEQDLETKGRIIGGIRARPPEQRQAAYDEARARLAEMGADVSRLPAEWDETFADQVIRESLEVAKALDMEDKARDFAERVRHNRAAEAVAAGGLAVRQGALGLARQREGRIAAGGGEDGDNSDLNYLMGD